jgi:TRIAP1/MDM35 family protein
MDSIGKECTPLKHEYDACFNKWYSERFLKGDVTPECDALFTTYKACVTVSPTHCTDWV